MTPQLEIMLRPYYAHPQSHTLLAGDLRLTAVCTVLLIIMIIGHISQRGDE